jgi:hypothetical protein
MPPKKWDVPVLIVGAGSPPSRYPLVLAGRGVHFNVKSVLDRVPCPGLVAVRVVDMPAMVLVPVWRATADNDGIPTFAEIASSLRRPNDQSR